jgi:hypothetical protein
MNRSHGFDCAYGEADDGTAFGFAYLFAEGAGH